MKKLLVLVATSCVLLFAASSFAVDAAVASTGKTPVAASVSAAASVAPASVADVSKDDCKEYKKAGNCMNACHKAEEGDTLGCIRCCQN